MVPGGRSSRDDRRHLADRGLHRHARDRVRGVRVRRPAVLDPGVPREGPDLPGPALDDGPLRQQGDRRDPRAAGLHGRLPDDDRVGDVHHQRHRARHRHPARPQPGRLPDGAQGRGEAGLHGEPDADAAAPGSSSRSTRRASSTRASTGSASSRSRRSSARCRTRTRPPASSSTRARTRRSSSCSTTRSTSSTRSRRTRPRARTRR